MHILREDQIGWEFDWFAVDKAGYLLHVSSGGGLIPEAASASKENLSALEHFFKNLPELSTNQEIQLTHVAVGNVSSFLHYVRRGFYSFDKTVMQEFSDPFYSLIAAPPRALKPENLPLMIATRIAPIYLPYLVADLPIIDFRTIGQLA